MRASQSHALVVAILLPAAALALYGLLQQVVGLIPFYGGAGFDGAIYIDYLQKIAAGEPVQGDPYRLMRLPGFVPTLLAAELGLPTASIVAWQRTANMLLLSVGLGLMFDLLRRLGQPARRAWLVVASLWLAWPYALMPVYNPMLSDHLALFCAVLSLWAWARSLRWLLGLLIVTSFWVMPGLFVVPLALLALPLAGRQADGAPSRLSLVFWVAGAGLVLGFACVWVVAAGVSAAEIDHHPPGTALGKSSLRPLTLTLIAGALLVAAVVAARLLSARAFWRSVQWPWAAGAVALALIGGGSVLLALDWGAGYKGPPLGHYLLLQGLAAPAKPLVAHFVYFGPLCVLAVAGVLCRLQALLDKGLAAVLGVCVGFLPLLVFASESRQWIYLLPLMAVVAASSARTAVLWLQLLFSALLLAPALVLRPATEGAAALGMLSDGWQLYFGRLGPWMGDGVYAVGGGLLLLFLLGVARLSRAGAAAGGRHQNASP